MNIKIKALTKKYENREVLKKVNIEIPDNSVFFLLGESGIGKTTLTRILLGLESYDSGSIEGIDNKKISAVFQEDRLLENLTIEANIKLVSDTITKDEITRLLQDIGVEAPINEIVSNLSGGMKRRIAILRALVLDFDFIVMDEPFKGLDEGTKKKVMDFVIDRLHNKKSLIVTHDKNEVEYFKSKMNCSYKELT